MPFGWNNSSLLTAHFSLKKLHRDNLQAGINKTVFSTSLLEMHRILKGGDIVSRLTLTEFVAEFVETCDEEMTYVVAQKAEERI